MNLKTKVLNILKSNNQYISGQLLADEFCVSRNAIWKAIKSLQNDGYNIDSVSNKGYRLLSLDDAIDLNVISRFFENLQENINIIYKSSVDSTNTDLKKLYYNSIPFNTLLIADEQSAGRGRFGRNFYSPSKTGVYFSLLIKPDLKFDNSSVFTSLTAVAVCDSIRMLTSKAPGIKWVNDIYINNKKVAGILTEASIDFETNSFDYLIIGIGINISTKNFPHDLAKKAGSLNSNISKSELIGCIISNFYKLYHRLPDTSFISDYKNYSIMINKDISYNINNVTYTGKVIDINDHGNLIVSGIDGISTLTSGEVTIIDF